MRAQEELVSIVGSPNFADRPQALEKYSDDLSLVPRIRPGAAVKASSAEKVKAVVKWANETRTPLVPVSSGAPHVHGSAVPSVGGAVVVDLSGMNKVIRVDRRNRVAMIEPGVTFDELIPAVEKEGLAAPMPLVPRSRKSVVTSFLERTPVTTPRFHWEPQDPLQCVEVIYGTGDLMRTGSAVMPASLERQWALGRAQLRGMGPSQVDFTRLLQGAQGTMGIVTWATIKCRPLARRKKMFLVAGEQLGPLVEMAYEITFRKLGDELLVLNKAGLAAILGKDREEIETIRAQLPSWVLVLGIEGSGVLPEERVAYQEAESSEVARPLGLELKGVIAGTRAEKVSEVLGRPSSEPYWKLRVQGAFSEIFFLTTLDRAADFVATVRGLAARCRYDADTIGVYVQPTVQGANGHVELTFPYAPQARQEADKVRRLMEEGAEALASRGAFFSRPYGPWARIAYRGDAQVAVGQRKLKNIFDPHGILNPGKLCF
ncbi:MAG: FAD-binding oxidoreductase [bacterium]